MRHSEFLDLVITKLFSLFISIIQVTNNSEKKKSRQNGTNGRTNSLVTHVLTNPGPEYWRTRNPLADDIVITDVTVNLSTVTIRECRTEKGFFRERTGTTDIK